MIAYVLLTAKAPFNDALGMAHLMNDIKGFNEDPAAWRGDERTHPFEEMAFKNLLPECRDFVQ